MRTHYAAVSVLALAAGAGAAPALAQTAPDRSGDAGEIVVTGAIARGESDVLQGTSVVTGEELTRDVRPSLGETLARQPGVSATSFGPSASRPVLRGFQGDRIRVLTDGIGSIDVSNTSADHAVIINPLLAERIEVLRGPAALLYGSSAVGGVVNVIDTRIPRTVPEAGVLLAGTAVYGSAARERTIEAAGDVALGKHFVLHADGSHAKSGDLRIGGHALTPERRREALASTSMPLDPEAEPIDFLANASVRGRLPNTAARTTTAAVGAAYVDDGGTIGLSYSHYDSLYGVPIRFATRPGQAQEAPRLDVRQERVDLRAEVDAGGGFLDRIRFRGAQAKYRHFELEPDGAIGTAFYNDGLESRLELVQANRGGWKGASGVQYFNRGFNVTGDEAFLPRSDTAQTGIFTLQQLDLGTVKAEAGGRFERTDVAARPLAGDLRFFAGKRDFATISTSLGASYGLGEAVRLGINLSYTERAPTAEELFANGAHAGTQVYELGSPDFVPERSLGLEATLHVHGAGFSLDAAAYYNDFTNYISENQVSQSVCEAAAAPSGRTVALPCFRYAQVGASYYGVEAEGSLALGTVAGFALNADLLGDYTRATLVDLSPVPRIPAPRLLGGIEAQSDRINARIEAERVFAQHRLAPFETRTAGYTMVNASVAVHPFRNNPKTTLLVSANNIFDVDARRHASFLKDFAPLAGRDIRATISFAL